MSLLAHIIDETLPCAIIPFFFTDIADALISLLYAFRLIPGIF